MDEKIIIKKTFDLKSGDVLAEDIPEYPNFKAGMVLDKEKIEKLIKLRVKNVKIKISKILLKNNNESTKEKKEKFMQQIKENIELAYLKHMFTEDYKVQLKEEDYSPEIRKKAKAIISHIQQSQDDIYKIESLRKKSLSKINQRINNRLEDVSNILMSLIRDKTFKLDQMREIVEGLIEDTGPKRDSTFLLLHLKRKAPHFIVKHSINVALLSLAIAIELSKIMKHKLENPEIKGDFKRLEICNRKIFDKEELIKLGIAALLHDLGLVESFPKLSEDTKFSLKDQSKIELHPNQAYHLLTKLRVDYEIRKSILQHHERVDGSGYPDGIKDRFFTKYGLVLSFADHLDLLTSKNPFVKKTHPHRAIMHILTKERSKFDADVLYSYCQAASLYPVGSWVLLSNSKIGVVMRTNKDNLNRPVVKCVLSSDLKELIKKEFIDLIYSDLKIMELVDIESLEMFDESIDRFMFDEREFERVDVDIEAEVNIVDTDIFHKGRIKNICAGGMRLHIYKKFLPGDKLLINFSLNGDRFEKVNGLIIWGDPKPDGGYRYGIRFIHLDEEYKQKILKFTENREKH